MSLQSSQIDQGQCAICLDQMAIEGEHQISSLPCGHLFGCCCIKRWLDDNQTLCPTCRKMATSQQIRLIKWDGTIPLDCARDETVKEANHKAKQQQQTFVQKLQKLERDYIVCQSDIAQKRKSLFGKTSFKTAIVVKPFSFPSLLLQQKLIEGFRVCITNKNIFASCKSKENDYGIKFCDRDSKMSYFKYLSLHSAQIHDIAPSPFDSQSVATVSMDKRLIVTGIRTDMPIFEATLPVPLWSCGWINHNLIAVGGTNGRLFIVNGRGMITNEIQICNGPPIFSIAWFPDNVLLVSSPLKSAILDTQKIEIISKAGEISGCHSAKCASNGQIVMLTRQNANKTVCCIGSKSKSHNISCLRTMSLVKYDRIARPAICAISAEKSICVLPDEENLSFKIITSDDTNRDFWVKWKRNFSNPSFPSPVLDIDCIKEEDFVVAAVSTDMLRIYSFPL